eukprot:scaffold2779_cov376-Prasinococcus_capsulatus_cf.AAC.1
MEWRATQPLGSNFTRGKYAGLRNPAEECSLQTHAPSLKKGGREAPQDPSPPQQWGRSPTRPSFIARAARVTAQEHSNPGGLAQTPVRPASAAATADVLLAAAAAA